eukprot:8638757-Pyramimonas_sp.AAC.1
MGESRSAEQRAAACSPPAFYQYSGGPVCRDGLRWIQGLGPRHCDWALQDRADWEDRYGPRLQGRPGSGSVLSRARHQVDQG